MSSSLTHDRRPAGVELNNSFWNIHESSVAFPKPQPIEAENIAKLFFEHAELKPKSWFSRIYDIEDGLWNIVHWEEAAEQTARVAFFLQETLKVQRQDRVAIISGTRHEWVIADLAILSAAAISVPIYQTLTPKEAAYVIWDSGAEYIFCENEEQLQKLIQIANSPQPLPETEGFPGGDLQLKIKGAICFEEPLSKSAPFPLYSLSNILKDSIPLNTIHKTVSETVNSISRDSLASIVYTSGTTGAAKGVVQSHANHIAMLDGVLLSRMVEPSDGLFLFLPLAHSFARVIAYATIATGGDIIFPAVVDKTRTAFDGKQLLKDISHSNPVIFPSVPRLFEKIMSTLSSRSNLRERIINWAIRKYRDKSSSNGIAKFIVKTVKAKVFGKKISHAISGGAPISPEVVEFFKSIDLPIYEGYGLTETCPALSVNTKDYWRIGTVGRPFPGVELKIADDGEILARGANIAQGYWKKPIATAEVFLADGWFATGDIGQIDEAGFLKITDRKKELIVTAGGKNVAPTMVEGNLKNSPFIAQACVFGDRRPFLVALVTLEIENVRKWCVEKGIKFASTAELAENEEVKQLVFDQIKKANLEVAPFERVRKAKILTEDFTIENGLLTPTLKLKRKLILQKFSAELDILYSSEHAETSLT